MIRPPVGGELIRSPAIPKAVLETHRVFLPSGSLGWVERWQRCPGFSMKNPAALSPRPTGSIIGGREPYGEVIHFQSLYRSVVGRNRIRDRAPGRRNDRGRRATAPLAVAGLDSGDHEAIGGKDSIATNAGLLDVRDGAPVAPDQFPQRVEQLSVKVSPLVRILEIGSVPPVTGWSDIGVQVPSDTETLGGPWSSPAPASLPRKNSNCRVGRDHLRLAHPDCRATTYTGREDRCGLNPRS